MIQSYLPLVYTAIFGSTYDEENSGEDYKEFNLRGDSSYLDIDGRDPRNFLLNLLENTHRTLLTIAPRLLGLQITKAFSTNNGNARVTYTVAFTYKETRANVLLDEPSLEAIMSAGKV